MQYSLLTLFTLVTAAMAVSQREHNEWVKRQAPQVQDSVPINVAAMTDAQGNVLQFDSTKVYLAGKAAGL
ncbi:hypothetical protein UCRPA7_2507 [Phaeoacremonium minimum UCRPA7]|uniref:Uncharacterized protein n=1 Tax=Phaeoacremonium minimum (strain UCR-PA7) TaxID=1286976 RepID=R8BRL3_PHAM7|nr:hypothetical protein UCRPA7_2507 [Phaeoacremonium minimum UCRPA7]EOO01981.1 hypothetical protein UCRPA7_2507 [Phaeoacremonium minimum UCRPA7]